jgi:hypothetical protein
MEQRVNNKFCFKLGKTPTEIYEMLKFSTMMKPKVAAVYFNSVNGL